MTELSALELSEAIKSKKYSIEEVVNSYINTIEKKDNVYNAFITVSKDYALSRAKEVQSLIDKGKDLSPLAGVPISIKDNISTKNIETTCASKTLSGYKPVFNAEVIDKIEDAGMIIIGKNNMDEFAMGGSSESGFYGAVRNPWDTSRVAGGSSGGSAAAVAAGEAPLSLGSDSGGSIRQPCAFCGVTGIKPTYGAVSRYGAVAYASSFDQIGVIARNIDDSAALLSVISGPDKKDSTCIIEKPFDFSHNIPQKFKIGIPKNYLESPALDDDVRKAVLAAADEFRASGMEIEEFDMPLMEAMVPAYYIIACAEASSNLSRFDGLKYGYRSPAAKTLSQVYRLSRSEGFAIEVKRRIMLGSFVLSSGYYDAYYKKAQQARALVKDSFKKLFERFDLILSPVAPSAAYKLGENIDNPLKMYMSDIFTVSVNLAGLPAASIPCGFGKNGLPIGCQLIADSFAEAKIIGAARLYQTQTDFHLKKPLCLNEPQVRSASVRENSEVNS